LALRVSREGTGRGACGGGRNLRRRGDEAVGEPEGTVRGARNLDVVADLGLHENVVFGGLVRDRR
jgi:hypothetical protein